MFGKLVIVLHNKIALTALGVLLVGAGGTAVVAAAANGTGIPLLHQSSSNGAGQDQDDENELRGAVNTVGSASFTVKLSDGTAKTVSVSKQTQFKDELHGLADLKAGMQVEVKGSAQSDGTFAATSVEAVNQAPEDKDEHDGELEGTVAKVEAHSFELKLEDGKTKNITVSDQTEFEDGLHGLADLKAGMQVEAKGSAQSDGTFAATKVEIKGEHADDHGGSSGKDDGTGGGH